MTIIEKLENMGFVNIHGFSVSENGLYYDMALENIGIYYEFGYNCIINIRNISEAQILERAETLLRWSKE